LDIHWLCDSQMFNVGRNMFSGLTAFELAPFAVANTQIVNVTAHQTQQIYSTFLGKILGKFREIFAPFSTELIVALVGEYLWSGL